MKDLARAYCDMDIVDDIFYSRRNFLRPEEQDLLHSSFAIETKHLNAHVEGGAPYTMGKVDVDCKWFPEKPFCR